MPNKRLGRLGLIVGAAALLAVACGGGDGGRQRHRLPANRCPYGHRRANLASRPHFRFESRRCNNCGEVHLGSERG